MGGNRRSDFDITNTVRVSSPREVLRATEQLLVSAWPQIVLAPVVRSFNDFDALFAGRMLRLRWASRTAYITIGSTRSMSTLGNGASAAGRVTNNRSTPPPDSGPTGPCSR